MEEKERKFPPRVNDRVRSKKETTTPPQRASKKCIVFPRASEEKAPSETLSVLGKTKNALLAKQQGGTAAVHFLQAIVG